MDIQALIQAVATVGFPIVACGAMFWLNLKTLDEHKVETKELTQAVNNNTMMIEKLLERLNIDEGKVI